MTATRTPWIRVLAPFVCGIAMLAAGPVAPAAAQKSVQGTEAERPLRPQAGEKRDRREVIIEIATNCGFYEDRRPGSNAFVYRDLALLSEMLRSNRPDCSAAAATFLHATIGEPERAEVDLVLLRMGRRMAQQGQGMAPDPALADRYGRMLWLFDETPPDLPRWPEAERQAWLARPETVALLRARTADSRLRTSRSRELLTGLLLSRDSADYDPQEALALIERSGDRPRISRLLSDGEHLPPDYDRAARGLIVRSYESRGHIRYQGELLHVARRAAAAARTPAERAQALRILSAATLDEYFSGRDGVNALLRRIGRVPETALAQEDAARVAHAIASQLYRLDFPPRSAGPRPIVLRALIGPDGRMVMTEVAQSSGTASLDYALRALWITLGADLDLSTTAQGRFVWATLPPVERSR